ncbi:MAG: hypothetical protein LBH61_06285 [Dysgonamonadaceae bacterium]|jgi:hypothetical protein|nr:hypothetical protein [Dysgonamonadaceae bacterium]
MKKIIFTGTFLLGLLVCIQPLKPQGQASGKHLFSELGGPGVIFSANFDSRFKNNERLGLGYRVGLGFGIGEFTEWTTYGPPDDYYLGYNSYTRTYYTIPAGLNYIFGKNHSPHTFEIGAGATFLTRKLSIFYYDRKKSGHVIGHFQFMYRRIPVNGGFTFRIGFTPIIGTSGDLFPFPAVGFGYAF